MIAVQVGQEDAVYLVCRYVFIVFTPSMSELLLPQDEMTVAEAMAAMAQMKFFLRTVV